MGMCLSYNSVNDTHATLAVGQIRRAQVAARSGHAISWDNTHLTLSVHVEQRTLGPAKVQTGTKIPEYVLRGLSDPEWLNLIPIIKRRATAPLITFAADIRPTMFQCEAIQNHLHISIFKLLIECEPDLNYLKDAPEFQHPRTYNTRACVAYRET
jgi:hypothetical protein